MRQLEERTMKGSQRWAIGLAALMMAPGVMVCNLPAAFAAEYQGRNIDGQSFDAQVYSYETGGLYDVQVMFRKRTAIMTFNGGAQQKIRLYSPVITNPHQIDGFGRPGVLTLGGIFSIGFEDNSSNNLEPPRPRPLEGFWSIRIREEELRKSQRPTVNLN